jgi:GFO/IDH/MocA oxidoreductase family protein
LRRAGDDFRVSDRSRIVVVGAGAIGARHVQAMARVTARIDLDIVDPVPAARHRAEAPLVETGGLRHGRVRGVDRIEQIDGAPDLAIVATNSRERPDAVRALIARGARAMILEKVLFTSLADHDAIDGLLAEAGVGAWVNCPRAAFPRAARLKELVGGGPVHYRVEGEGWGLGCNLIHHLHEFWSLSGGGAVELDPSGLEPEIASSKRAGYVEFFGRMSGRSADSATFAATCVPGAASRRTVRIDAGDSQLTLSPQQTLTIASGSKVTTEPYPATPQSELTAGYVDAILAGSDPGIPDYPSASNLHRVMLGAFLEHLRRVRGDDTIDECPVT